MSSTRPIVSSSQPVVSSGEASAVTEATDASEFDPQHRVSSGPGAESALILCSRCTHFVQKTGGIVSAGSGSAESDIMRKQVTLLVSKILA